MAAKDWIVHSGESDKEVIERNRQGGSSNVTKEPVLGINVKSNEAMQNAQVQVAKNIAEKTGYGGEYELAGGGRVRVEVQKETVTTQGADLSRVARPSGQSTQLTTEQLTAYGLAERKQPKREEYVATITPMKPEGWVSKSRREDPFFSPRRVAATYVHYGGKVWEGFSFNENLGTDLATGNGWETTARMAGVVGGIATLGSSETVYGGYKAAKVSVQTSRANFFEKIGLATKEYGLTSEQAATKAWMKSSTAGRAGAYTVKTVAEGVIATEAINLGGKTYNWATTSTEDRQLRDKYKAQYSVARQEAYEKTSGGFLYNIQPLVAEKLTKNKRDPIYKETMRSSLEAQGVPTWDATRLSELGTKQRKTMQWTELGAMVNIESKSELYGRRAFGWMKQEGINTYAIREGEKVGKFQLRMGGQAWARQAPGVAVAGSIEGGLQYYAQQRINEQPVKPLELGISAGIGAGSAAGFQYMIQAPAFNPKTKWVSVLSRGSVEGLEGGNEFMGDTFATVRQRTRRDFTGSPIVEPKMRVTTVGKSWSAASFTFGESPGHAKGGTLNPVAIQTYPSTRSNVYPTTTLKVDVTTPTEVPTSTTTRTRANVYIDTPISTNTNVFANTFVNTKVDTKTDVNVPVDSSVWDAGVIPPILPAPFLGGFGGYKSKRGVKSKTKYNPSVEAIVFNIKQPKFNKGKMLSGLELRPL